jgi:protein N-terminal glutamine amidohydrolase
MLAGVTVEREGHAYTAFYCEENVWHLAGDQRLRVNGAEGFVVFISNLSRCCPMWSQRASTRVDHPVMWDYHVVYLAAREGAALVYDLDTRLGFPEPLDRYLIGSFPLRVELGAELEPLFRVIEADEFRRTFASDRSHMIVKGRYRAAPPEWPCIRTEEATMNLDRYIDMSSGGPGVVCDLDALLSRFVK